MFIVKWITGKAKQKKERMERLARIENLIKVNNAAKCKLFHYVELARQKEINPPEPN